MLYIGLFLVSIIFALISLKEKKCLVYSDKALIEDKFISILKEHNLFRLEFDSQINSVK